MTYMNGICREFMDYVKSLKCFLQASLFEGAKRRKVEKKFCGTSVVAVSKLDSTRKLLISQKGGPACFYWNMRPYGISSTDL